MYVVCVGHTNIGAHAYYSACRLDRDQHDGMNTIRNKLSLALRIPPGRHYIRTTL